MATNYVTNNNLASQFGATGNFNQLPTTSSTVTPTKAVAPTPVVAPKIAAPAPVAPTFSTPLTTLAAPKAAPVAAPVAAPQPTALPMGSTPPINWNAYHGTGTTFTPPAAPAASAQSGLSQFVSNNSPTPGGGTITTNGSGNVTNFTPASLFSVNTDPNVPSSALGSNTSTSDLQNQHAQYSDYVNALSQSQQYSPAYIQAQQGVFNMQTRDAALQQNQLSGLGFAGGTADYAANITNRARSENAIEGLQSQQALDVQSLIRQGNISAAQTQLQYSPVGMTGAQAITQYQQLGQLYPGAAIPPFNPTQDPQAQLQMARQMVANSPAYQAGFQSTYQTPGGGTGIFSKLNMRGFQQNPDGSVTLVPAAAAALGAANAKVVGDQVSNLSSINGAIESSSKTIDTMTQFMNQYGLNQANVPIMNQVMNYAKAHGLSTDPNAPGIVGAAKVDLNTLRSDYEQFLMGRGGSVAGVNQEAMNTLPDNISPAQLQVVYSQMKQDGLNTAESISNQVNQALQGIQTNTSASTSGAAPQTQSTGGSVGWY